jgi:hypothetical protein
LALATPEATTPMPASATSLTDTLAAWFTCGKGGEQGTQQSSPHARKRTQTVALT